MQQMLLQRHGKCDTTLPNGDEGGVVEKGTDSGQRDGCGRHEQKNE